MVRALDEGAFDKMWHASKASSRSRIALCAATCMILSAHAHANLVIDPTFSSLITSDPNAAAIEATINAAISVYETDFSDPITVAIDFTEMSSGLGESSAYYDTVPYATYRNALAADAKTANDASAMALLPASSTNPVTGSTTIEVKTADLRAVGINANPPAGQPDGTVSLNTSITNPGSTGTSALYSLLAVAEHEIDEVLGLGSGLNSTATIFPEDLFRYAANGSRFYASSNTAAAYFSINGTTDLAQFNNIANGGDFGDWASDPLPTGVSPQVQDAFSTPGSTPTLGPNELEALDVIGYDLTVPEPASIALLATGLTALISRRRRVPRRACPKHQPSISLPRHNPVV